MDTGTALRAIDTALGTPADDNPLGLIVVHVENFGQLVSAIGYRHAAAAADALCERLRRAARPVDTVVRIGETRFAVIFPGIHDEGYLILAANKILRTLDDDTELAGDVSRLNFRLGMALSPAHGADSDRLLQVAETALLVAAEENRSYGLYAPDDPRTVMNLWHLEHELDDAVQNGELELHYQPKIVASTGHPCGAEALMRWNSPRRGFVPPDLFIRVADTTGRIEALTWFALNTASRHTMQWPDQSAPLSVAVNVTPNIIEHSDVLSLAQNALGLWNLPPERLVIELTEGALIRNPEKSHAVLNELRAAGMRVAIDDFGTGYSSLAYFKNVPADELKIDKSFVKNMLNDEADAKIVETVISLAHGFGLKVTAEGVEDGRTAQALAALGCDYLQGYYYSKPVNQKAFCSWLAGFRGADWP